MNDVRTAAQGLIDAWDAKISPFTLSARVEELREALEQPQLITEQDLYSIGQESITAFKKMEQLCNALGLPYPPKQQKEQQ